MTDRKKRPRERVGERDGAAPPYVAAEGEFQQSMSAFLRTRRFVDGTLATRFGAEMVLAMMHPLFVGLADMAARGVPIRDLTAVQVEDVFKYKGLRSAGPRAYMRMVLDPDAEPDVDLPPEVAHWREFPDDISPSLSVSAEVMAQGDVYALGHVVAGVIEHTPFLFGSATKLARRIRMLCESMVEEDLDLRETPAECLRRFETTMGVLQSDATWTKRGQGGYACVGVQGDGVATKLYFESVRPGEAQDEAGAAAALGVLDPDRRFTIAVDGEPGMYRLSRFPGSVVCEGGGFRPYVLGLRMQAAAWTLTDIDSQGAADVATTRRFWEVQQSLFEGLVVFHRHGFSHHDIKPANIVFDRAADCLKFIDFGLSGAYNYSSMAEAARATEPGYRYFSPEYLLPAHPLSRELNLQYVKSLFSADARAGVSKAHHDTAWSIAVKINEARTARGQVPWVVLSSDPGEIRPCSAPPMGFFDYVKRGQIRFDVRKHTDADTYSKSDVFALGYTLMEVLLTHGALRRDRLFDALFDVYYQMIELDVSQRLTAAEALRIVQHM